MAGWYCLHADHWYQSGLCKLSTFSSLFRSSASLMLNTQLDRYHFDIILDFCTQQNQTKSNTDRLSKNILSKTNSTSISHQVVTTPSLAASSSSSHEQNTIIQLCRHGLIQFVYRHLPTVVGLFNSTCPMLATKRVA